MKKFLYMSLIQGDATSLGELQAVRELNEQELALVTGGFSEHGPSHHDTHHDDEHHHHNEHHHGNDWDHRHRNDWDDKHHRGHK